MRRVSITVTESKDNYGNTIYTAKSKKYKDFSISSCDVDKTICRAMDVIDGIESYKRKKFMEKVYVIIFILLMALWFVLILYGADML